MEIQNTKDFDANETELTLTPGNYIFVGNSPYKSLTKNSMCRFSKYVIVLFLMVAGILACNHKVMAQKLISTTYTDSLVTNLPFLYRNFNKIQTLNNPANEYIVVSNAETLGASYVIAKLDSSGNMIKQRLLYRGSYSTYITGTFIFYENKLIVPTWHDWYSTLLVFDVFLNLIDSINISKPIGTTDSSNQYIKRTGASEIIYDIDTIGGYIYLTGGLYSLRDSLNEEGNRIIYHQNIRAVVYKYNSDLQLIWRKEVGDTNNFKYNMGQKLLSLKEDGQLCVVAQNQRFILNHRIEFQPFTSRVTFYKLDTSGNVLHQNTLPKEPGRWYFRQVANACAVTPQNEVVLGGYYCDSSLAEYDGQGKVLLFNVDSAFNLKWEYIGATAYKTNAVNKVLIDSNGNIMAAGQHEQLVYRNRPWNDSVIVSGFMAWFTPNGELTKWSNVYPIKVVTKELKNNRSTDTNTSIYYVSDILPISDGRFAGCGMVVTPKYLNISSPWFFITDSNGCVNATCDTSLYILPQDTLPQDTVIGGFLTPNQLQNIVHLSPNPATTQVHVESPIKTERYTLTNTSGTTIQSGVLDASNSIDVSQLPPGLYFLQLQLENGQTVTKKLVRSSK